MTKTPKNNPAAKLFARFALAIIESQGLRAARLLARLTGNPEGPIYRAMRRPFKAALIG